jgi:hypothetical protein
MHQRLWKAPYHVVADIESAVPLSEVDCGDIAGRLRFISNRDRLTVRGGRIDAKQLQTMRELTPSSAGLLAQRWIEEFDVQSAACASSKLCR